MQGQYGRSTAIAKQRGAPATWKKEPVRESGLILDSIAPYPSLLLAALSTRGMRPEFAAFWK